MKRTARKKLPHTSTDATSATEQVPTRVLFELRGNTLARAEDRFQQIEREVLIPEIRNATEMFLWRQRRAFFEALAELTPHTLLDLCDHVLSIASALYEPRKSFELAEDQYITLYEDHGFRTEWIWVTLPEHCGGGFASPRLTTARPWPLRAVLNHISWKEKGSLRSLLGNLGGNGAKAAQSRGACCPQTVAWCSSAR
jgi:hypothetical protein